MIANYNRKTPKTRVDAIPSENIGKMSGSSFSLSNSAYSGFASSVANPSAMSKIAANLTGGADSLSKSLASNLIPPGVKLTPVKNPKNEDAEKNPKPMKEDGMLASLVKIILGVLSIPGKFATALSAVMNASAGITLSTGGIVQIAGLALYHMAIMFKVSVEVIIRHITTLTDFVIKLPKCFLVHIVKMVFAVLYLIFPLSSFLVWSFTGVSLMPAFNSVFKMLDDGDNWISDNIFGESKIGKIYLLKFPAEITKHCYYCNGKPYRLNDIIDDLSKISDTGKNFGDDVEKKAMPTMKPAIPFLMRTKRLVDKLMK
jgi:hypothetical protein